MFYKTGLLLCLTVWACSLFAEENKANREKVAPWKMITIEASATMTLDLPSPKHTDKPTAMKCNVVGLSPSKYSCVVLENNLPGGFSLKKNTNYRVTFLARSTGKIQSVHVLVPVLEGNTIMEGTVKSIGDDWKSYSLLMTANRDYDKARLCFNVSQTGTIEIDDVSFQPEK